METSLTVPTATSVRAVPAKLLADNRIVINNHLRRARGGKVSFTHLIGYALVQALRDYPEMNNSFAEVDGQPGAGQPGARQPRPGHRPAGQERLPLAGRGQRQGRRARWTSPSSWRAYEDIIRRARQGKLTADDFAGTTISLTNPGTIGTDHSVPRLMPARARSSASARWSTRPSSPG